MEGGRWEVSDQEIVCSWPRTEVGGVGAAGAVVPTSAVAAEVRSARLSVVGLCWVRDLNMVYWLGLSGQSTAPAIEFGGCGPNRQT